MECLRGRERKLEGEMEGGISEKGEFGTQTSGKQFEIEEIGS